MYIHIDRIMEHIGPNDRVLDLGGWERVFPRADVVVDLNPYDSRKVVYPGIPENFSRDSWIQADFCSPKFWRTIKDKEFDFVIISHTLEDIRDPLYVCSEMIRCSKAGYIEVPSKFRECGKEHADAEWAGYSHHRWIVEPMLDRTGLIFKAKLSWAHAKDYVGEQRRHLLTTDYHYQFNGFFWLGSFRYLEHFPKGPILESADLEYFYKNYPYDSMPEFLFTLAEDSRDLSDGSCLYVTEYKLASEGDRDR